MKKLGLIIAFVIFTTGSVFAQGKPSFGFKIGSNLVNVNSSNDVSLGNTFDGDGTGFHAGLVLHIPLVKKSGLQIEGLYSAEGIEDIDLAYINVPVLYTYKILPGLRLQLGPQIKINVDADVSINNGIEADIDNRAAEEDFKDFNFDAAAGLEYRIPIIGIFVQGRAIFGLNDIGDEDFGKSQSIQLSVGYRF